MTMFSSRAFMVWGNIFKSWTNYEFIFVFVVREWFRFIILHVSVQFSQYHFLKRLLLRHCILLPSLLYISWLYKQRFISDFSIFFPLICVCFCASIILFWLLWLCSRVSIQGAWYLHIGCLYLDALALCGLLWFHINRRIISSSS